MTLPPEDLTPLGEQSQLQPHPLQPQPPAYGLGPAPTERPKVTTFRMRFTGKTDEYFRIWIVNTALTIVTLGLYTPWARIRNRQYFYGHTWLDGHNFEYTANPLALLRGYLLIGGLFALFSAAIQFEFEGWEWVAGLLFFAYLLGYPWIVRQAMRFQARSTVHRGLNFQFLGTLGDSYVAYGLANFAVSVTGTVALPWAWFMQRRYQAGGLAYGESRGKFRGELSEFYMIGLKAFGLGLGTALILGLLGFLAYTIARDGGLLGPSRLGDEAGWGAAIAAGAFYLLFLAAFSVVWQYARVATMKYVLSNFELGGIVRTRATFNVWQLVWIETVNLLARFFSLGLLIPWAAIRTNKYLISHIEVRTIASLDQFTGRTPGPENAIGEAATDLLDIDIGF